MSFTQLVADWLAGIPSDPWPVALPLTGTILVALLYWRGVRYEWRTGIGRPITALHIGCFVAGLLILLLAVASPLDTLADQGLAAHMTQHELLVLIVPPLLLFAEPIWPIWRALPARWRRASLRWLLRRHWARRVGERIGRVVSHPIGAWALFIGVFLVWHIPALYDLALENEAIHAVEHGAFLATALLFWAQVIPSFPLQPRLSYLQRAAYIFVAGCVLHLQSIFISIAAQPIYPFYGTSSAAIADQAAGGATMDVFGMVIFTIALLLCLGLWLRDDERKTLREAEGIPAEPTPNISARGALLIAEADLAEPATPSGGAEK